MSNPEVNGDEHPGGVADGTKYADFIHAHERRADLIERFDGAFNMPLNDQAAEHQIYMETTVRNFEKKIAHLDRLLRSEKARRTQIGMTFRSFFKDTVLEIQQYGAEQRSLANARITERFEETKRRLEELAVRIPREQQDMLDDITEKTEAIRKQVDHFLNVDCAQESTGCKVRHQALVGAIGTGAMYVEDEINAAQKRRQNSMDELRDQLWASSQLSSKNANQLKSKLQYELASIKNALTTESLMRELNDTQLAAMVARQMGLLMQSAKCVNSTIGIDEVDEHDYATERTLRERQRKLEEQLRAQLRLEEETRAAAEEQDAAGGGRETPGVRGGDETTLLLDDAEVQEAVG